MCKRTIIVALRYLFSYLSVTSLSPALAQQHSTADSLKNIIFNKDNPPENRIVSAALLGEYCVNKANDLQKATYWLNQGRQISHVLKYNGANGELFFIQALIQKKSSHGVLTKDLNDRAIAELKKKKAGYFLGEALLEKGDYLNTNEYNQYKEKVRLLHQAINCFKKAEERWIVAGIWKALGDLYSIRSEISGNIGFALEAYQNAKNVYFSYGYQNIQDVYIAIAEIYRSLGDNGKGLKYSLLAIQTAEKGHDTSMTMCQIYNHTGLQYASLLDYDNAKKYLNEALNYAVKFHDQDSGFSIALNLFFLYSGKTEFTAMKQLIDQIRVNFPLDNLESRYFFATLYLKYFTVVKDINKGRNYCLYLMNLTSHANADILRSFGRDTYAAISDFFGMAHEFKDAYRYWQKAYWITLRFDNTPANKGYEYLAHYKIDSASRHLDSAIYYLRLYSKLRDSNFTKIKAQQAANLKVLFDTQKKEFELAESKQKVHMLTQNELLQKANLHQALQIRDITVIATVIIFLVSALLFRMVMLNKKAFKKIGKTNKLLEKALAEKEWLLLEIHHRVKNNLQTVACLLESEAACLESHVSKVFDDSRHRIYAMSLIHEKLCDSENLEQLAIDDFVGQLVNYLRAFYKLDNFIRFEVEVPKIYLETSVAISIGLIINEAITNAIKYAFVGRNEGKIAVTLFHNGGLVTLIITDDGIGIAGKYLKKPVKSMGMKLMFGLCDDLGGTIIIDNKAGTEVRLQFNPTIEDTQLENMEELINNIAVRDDF